MIFLSVQKHVDTFFQEHFQKYVRTDDSQNSTFNIFKVTSSPFAYALREQKIVIERNTKSLYIILRRFFI